MDNISEFKQKFNIILKQYLEQKLNIFSGYTKDKAVLDYIFYLNTIVLAGGKRIRPYLAYLMYKTLGGEEEEVLKLLVFLEIFHSFCLIHDDIMDKANLRHGVRTANSYIGNSQAILLGDLLFSWAQEIVDSNQDFSSQILQEIKKIIHEMTDEVCIGQMLDVDITTRKNVSKELIDEKTSLKTAGYSFVKPLLIGATLTGKSTNEIETFCKDFGKALGFAFQIQDDLLDITSSDKQLGKTTSSDKSQNQHTYFTYFPSMEHGKKIISENFEKARGLIEDLSINENGKKKFHELVDLIQKRTS